MTVPPHGVPSLESLCDEWIAAADLDHLHSLRNQWGQAHVNADLASISWLAIPPYSGGYRTGALKVDGRVPAAAAFKWTPWGVRRRAELDGITIHTDTRLGYEATNACWRVEVTNNGTTTRTVTLELELLAPVCRTDHGWGWLYDTPWNHGQAHDYYSTERIRADVLAAEPLQVQLVPEGSRFLRLGRPRVPGIQRDEDDSPMLMESGAALPDHTAPDTVRTRPPAARFEVSYVAVSDGAREQRFEGLWRLEGDAAEVRLPAVALVDGGSLAVGVRMLEARDGAILTHGNHPDSAQFAIEDGRLVARLGGELIDSGRSLLVGETHRLELVVSSDGAALLIDGEVVGRTRPWWDGQRWVAEVTGETVVVADSASVARSAFAFSHRPDAVEVAGQRGVARWRLPVRPGETVTVGAVLEIGDDAATVTRAAATAAKRFDTKFASIAESWRVLWANAFSPGNRDHSGYLPVFTCPDADLARTYYFGILLALYLRNTSGPIGPVFLTGGPRLGPTTTFYWDQAEWPRVAAMLEPSGMRAWILAALGQPYESSHSFDTRNLLPVGNHYASNDLSLFTITEHYVGITGDAAVLEEVVRGRTVLDHLREMAFRPSTRRAKFAGGVLADLGRDPWELLECVPNYRDAVVSFNAAYAGMQRSLAELLELRGDPEGAAHARTESLAMTEAVLGAYAGRGRWRIGHPEGTDTIGHCLDFELVAANLAGELSESQRAELVEFVTGHLLDGDWMRALDPADPIAPISDRPDHGSAGAFAGWPGSTSYGLARLGRPDLAAAFLGRVHRSRSGALWGQAVEAIGGGRFRVAERGASNRDSNAAVAVSEAVVAGLFGIQAGFGTAGTGTTTSQWGSLRGVRAIGFELVRPTTRVEPEPWQPASGSGFLVAVHPTEVTLR